MGMMTDLLGTLPSATFDKEPAPSMLLAMTAPNAATWSVGAEDDVLRIQIGATVSEIDLVPLTLEELRTALAAAGLSGGEIEWNGSATLLVPGQTGTAAAGDFVRLFGYTNPLWAILRPYDRELRAARDSGITHIEQLTLPSAQGYWVDFWGGYFGVPRRSGESDAAYAERIVAEVFRARNTRLAIEGGIEDSLGWSVCIKETWRKMFVLSRSRLSGMHHFPGDYYRYHIIQPCSEEAVDWDLVEEQIHLLRPAGTLMWEPYNWGQPKQFALDLPTDLIGESTGLAQRWIDLSSGRLSRDLELSGNYFFLRATQAQVEVWAGGQQLRVFYSAFGTGDPTWDETPWSAYEFTTWRDKTEVAPPILGQCSYEED